MTKEIRIGLLAIVALAMLIWGYKFLLGTNILLRSSTYYVEYDNVDNLQISDPVYINGFKVGTVKNIYIKPEDLNKLVVVLDVSRDIKLPQNTLAELKNLGMMGAKVINLHYTGQCSEDCLNSGDYIQGATLGFIKSLVQPSEVELYMETLRKGVGGVIDSINQNLMEGGPDSGIATILHDLKETMTNLKNATAGMNRLLNVSAGNMNASFSHLEAITLNLKENNEAITGLLKNSQEITRQLAASRLDTSVAKANTAMDQANEAIHSLDETLGKANETFAELQKLLAQMNSGQGSIGLLLQDRELYDNLTHTTRNLDLLLQDFRLNPKRYVHVSVIGRKGKEYQVPENDPAFAVDSLKR